LSESPCTDQPQGPQNVVFVFDQEFGNRRNAENTLGDWIFSDLAPNAGIGKFFTNDFNLGLVARREQQFHMALAMESFVPFAPKSTRGNPERYPGESPGYCSRIYEQIEDRLGTAAHSHYNSLIRRIVSYVHALEREKSRRGNS
jgi:hypothetical protein